MKKGMYKHIRTGNLYSVIQSAKVKIGGEWFDGVLYVSAETPGELFCRTEKQFKEKFEWVQ